jgi:hypothetical protein
MRWSIVSGRRVSGGSVNQQTSQFVLIIAVGIVFCIFEAVCINLCNYCNIFYFLELDMVPKSSNGGASKTNVFECGSRRFGNLDSKCRRMPFRGGTLTAAGTSAGDEVGRGTGGDGTEPTVTWSRDALVCLPA